MKKLDEYRAGLLTESQARPQRHSNWRYVPKIATQESVDRTSENVQVIYAQALNTFLCYFTAAAALTADLPVFTGDLGTMENHYVKMYIQPMPRKARLTVIGTIRHLMSRSNGGIHIFLDDEDR